MAKELSDTVRNLQDNEFGPLAFEAVQRGDADSARAAIDLIHKSLGDPRYDHMISSARDNPDNAAIGYANDYLTALKSATIGDMYTSLDQSKGFSLDNYFSKSVKRTAEAVLEPYLGRTPNQLETDEKTAQEKMQKMLQNAGSANSSTIRTLRGELAAISGALQIYKQLIDMHAYGLKTTLADKTGENKMKSLKDKFIGTLSGSA